MQRIFGHWIWSLVVGGWSVLFRYHSDNSWRFVNQVDLALNFVQLVIISVGYRALSIRCGILAPSLFVAIRLLHFLIVQCIIVIHIVLFNTHYFLLWAIALVPLAQIIFITQWLLFIFVLFRVASDRIIYHWSSQILEEFIVVISWILVLLLEYICVLDVDHRGICWWWSYFIFVIRFEAHEF